MKDESIEIPGTTVSMLDYHEFLKTLTAQGYREVWTASFGQTLIVDHPGADAGNQVMKTIAFYEHTIRGHLLVIAYPDDTFLVLKPMAEVLQFLIAAYQQMGISTPPPDVAHGGIHPVN